MQMHEEYDHDRVRNMYEIGLLLRLLHGYQHQMNVSQVEREDRVRVLRALDGRQCGCCLRQPTNRHGQSECRHYRNHAWSWPRQWLCCEIRSGQYFRRGFRLVYSLHSRYVTHDLPPR